MALQAAGSATEERAFSPKPIADPSIIVSETNAPDAIAFLKGRGGIGSGRSKDLSFCFHRLLVQYDRSPLGAKDLHRYLGCSRHARRK